MLKERKPPIHYRALGMVKDSMAQVQAVKELVSTWRRSALLATDQDSRRDTLEPRKSQPKINLEPSGEYRDRKVDLKRHLPKSSS